MIGMIKKKDGEKVTIYDDKLLFRDIGVVYMLNENILPMITDYDLKKKQIHLMLKN